jgi:hypothetical protein
MEYSIHRAGPEALPRFAKVSHDTSVSILHDVLSGLGESRNGMLYLDSITIFKILLHERQALRNWKR